ncbi:uncharacterized protein LOC127115311 [Lathyrus oleraceus]|uniref:uncharacterized protein LOC127115311 n=1 Tax=Pisum sativum TaxID=3888 RepID=UPI0021CDFF44|nr:uncharacterized protein LOC127115311 [Pisum sativum]
MSQHQDTSASKYTKSTQKVSAPPMGIPDDEILDVVPSLLFHTRPLEDIHHTDRVIRDLVTRILNEGHFVKGVSTPLSQMYPSLEVEQHSGKDDDSSSSEKDLAAEGLCSLGKTVSEKGKSVASKTTNASHSEKHDVIDLEDGSSDDQEESLLHHLKPSSKVEVKKRKVKDDSESEEDVEEHVPDISPVKKTTVRKSPGKVPAVHLDNISFHIEDEVAKWKFVIQRRVAVERELGKDAADVKEVMDLIKAAGLLKTVAGFSQCYEGLVKDFIVNIPEDIADKNNKEFCKVFVRGRKIEGAGELEVTNNEVCREITSRQVKGWSVKKHLPAGKLIVKFMLEQIIKHASTNAVKLPIAFPSMIYGIILNQHPGIICSNDLPSRKKLALSVHYKLFEGSHVEDIVMTSAMKRPTLKVGTIAELKET